VARAWLVGCTVCAFGCASDGFDPWGSRGGSSPGEAARGDTGGRTTSEDSSGGTGTGGSDVHPASGGTDATRATGGTAPRATGGSAGARALTGGSAAGGGVSYCPETGTPTLERVVVSCVADAQVRAAVFQCISSLDPSWQVAAARYLACTDCGQVMTQVDCLLGTCRSDADGVLTIEDLVRDCSWTVAAGAGLGY
jgi:hypothetical protein